MNREREREQRRGGKRGDRARARARDRGRDRESTGVSSAVYVFQLNRNETYCNSPKSLYPPFHYDGDIVDDDAHGLDCLNPIL